MSKLEWDSSFAEKLRTGLGNGVLYFKNHPASAWNGLYSLSEKADQGDVVEGNYNGMKFVQMRTPDSFSASIEAYTYPEALDSGDVFDLSYRVDRSDSYELHLVYNAEAVFQEHLFETEGSESLSTFTLEVFTIPSVIDGHRSGSHIWIDTLYVEPAILSEIENRLYGTDLSDPYMPTIPEVVSIFEEHSTFLVVDHGDGTWTATGPDSWFTMLDGTTFQIETPSAEYVQEDTYRLRSW